MQNKILRLAVFTVGICMLGCNKEPNATKEEPIQKGIQVQLRPDAVEPSAPIDIEYSIGGAVQTDSNVAPGVVINLGKVQPKTKILFRVHNNHGAGTVRANVLTNDCFRQTGKCDGKNCIAEAEYEAIEEGCPNF